MSDRLLRRLTGLASFGTLLTAAIGLRWNPSLSRGVLAGGAWNLINLWCLAGALHAWLAPESSRRASITWFLVKFPLLYAVAVVCVSRSSAYAVGFGIGFSVVLVSALLASLLSLHHASSSVGPHGS